jgi:ribosomal protein L23
MPIKINIITSRGSRVAAGRHFRRQADWKKAIVTLKPGETIQVYEGV